MVLDGVGEAGLGVPRGAVAPAAAAYGGGGVPVRERRRGLVGELRGEVGNRFRGLSRAEDGREGVLHGELKGRRRPWRGGGVLDAWSARPGCEGRNGQKGNEVVLVRALEERMGLFPELATAAAMWRSRGQPGAHGKGRRAPARGNEGGEEPGHDAWEATASRSWPAALSQWQAAPLCAGSGGSREGERRKTQAGLVCNFQKVWGPTVKQK
jgi:hypothetical protein